MIALYCFCQIPLHTQIHPQSYNYIIKVQNMATAVANKGILTVV